MNVLILIFGNLFELLVGRVSRNDKLYELHTAFNRARKALVARTYLPCRRLTTFIHPPAREDRVLAIVRWKEQSEKSSVNFTCFVWAPNASNKNAFLTLQWGVNKNRDQKMTGVGVPERDDRCSFQQRQPICCQTRATIRLERPLPLPHVAQQ